ncbi:HAD family hydrolase [Paenibacillus sp. YPG26]|uniref:HAD family hydrolase n=1 Tax=Paenibacillus sp. YPG26 TaxID=2878915 RepID=UPI00203B4895|nr:HAD family hydrolase [Paenibacillus sp. YPG26]USB34323.1 HAD family hydrolase [Paenibacillus sp. YPG26]
MPVLRAQGFSRPITSMLFDKDGTLLDMLMLWGRWAEGVNRQMADKLAELGGTIPGGLPGLLGTILDGQGRVTGYDKTGPLAMASEEETLGLLAWQLYSAGIPWNEALKEVRDICRSAMHQVRTGGEVQPVEGLRALLEQCRSAGVKLAVVTTDCTANARQHLEAMSIGHYFDSIVGRDKVTTGKPAPDLVRLACRELGTLPEEAVVIGDSNADMQMGRAAGAAVTIGYGEGEQSRAYLLDADVVISSYLELDIEP